MATLSQCMSSNDGSGYSTNASFNDVLPLAADIKKSSTGPTSDCFFRAAIAAAMDVDCAADADCSTTILTTSRSNGSSSPENSTGSPCIQHVMEPSYPVKANSDGSQSPRSNCSHDSDSDGSQDGAEHAKYGSLHIENLELGDDAQVFSISTPTGDKITLTPGVEVFAMLSPRSDQEFEVACALTDTGGPSQSLLKFCAPHQLQAKMLNGVPDSIESSLNATAQQPAVTTFCSSRQDEQRRKVEMFLNGEKSTETAPSTLPSVVTDFASNKALLDDEVDCDHVSWESSSNASVDCLQDA